MRRTIQSFVIAVGILAAAQAFGADGYKIDPVHSTIGFSVKHMMVSRVPGSFGRFDGAIMYDPNDVAVSKVDVTIQVDSIDTRNEKRDDHLKSPDFFDAAQFPVISFVSKKITADTIVGDLTIKGVTKEVTIQATISGPVNAMDKQKIGINGSFVLNRQDYGIVWNKVLDQGGTALSDQVEVNISIEADKE